VAHGNDHASVTAGPINFVVEHRTVVQDGVETGGPTVRILGVDEVEVLVRSGAHSSTA
jgi:hypothetical protein